MQCQRSLWLVKNPPAITLPEDPAKQARLAAGIEVGLLAQQLNNTAVNSIEFDGF